MKIRIHSLFRLSLEVIIIFVSFFFRWYFHVKEKENKVLSTYMYVLGYGEMINERTFHPLDY